MYINKICRLQLSKLEKTRPKRNGVYIQLNGVNGTFTHSMYGLDDDEEEEEAEKINKIQCIMLTGMYVKVNYFTSKPALF